MTGFSLGILSSITAAVTPTGATYGYWNGGYTGGGLTTTPAVAISDRITYSTGVNFANTASNVTANKGGITGVSDKSTYGYNCGGGGYYNGSYTAAIDRTTFSTSATAANTANVLSKARFVSAGASDGSTYGYVCGGYSTTSEKITDRITFSTSTTAANTASDLSTIKNGPTGVSSSLYGYICGGNSGPNLLTTDRITFSTSATAANTASNLSATGYGLSGLSDGSTYGYISGGDLRAKTTDRIVFSTSVTSANTVSNLSVDRIWGAGLSDGVTYGYVGGGFTNTTGVTVERITFSTGVFATNTVSNLSVSKFAPAGFSDFAI